MSYVSSPFATWAALLFLLAVHLGTNYAAVRAVKMRTLNRQRANLILSSLLEADQVLTPQQVSIQERIFERDGVLRWQGSTILGYCRIGVSFDQFLTAIGSQSQAKAAASSSTVDVKSIAKIFQGEEYMLWPDQRQGCIVIVLKTSASVKSQLKAWAHALAAQHKLQSRKTRLRLTSPPQDILDLIGEMLKNVNRNFPSYIGRLKDVGWDLETAALETRSGYRVMLRT